MKHIKLLVTGLLLSLTLLFGGCSPDSSSESPSQTSDREASYNLESIPEYTGDPYVVINENVPFFTESDFTEEAAAGEKAAKYDAVVRWRKGAYRNRASFCYSELEAFSFLSSGRDRGGAG